MAKQYTKINVTMPNEMLELLDMYAEYEGLTRSSALGFLLAKGILFESTRTNGFDFESPFDVFTKDNGESVTIKRSDIKNLSSVSWTMLIGRNKRQEDVIVSNNDFDEHDNESPSDAKKE